MGQRTALTLIQAERGQYKPVTKGRNRTLTIAAMSVASPLLRGLIQSIRGGQAIDLTVHYDVDRAFEALEDGVVDAAFYMSIDRLSQSTGLSQNANLDTGLSQNTDLRHNTVFRPDRAANVYLTTDKDLRVAESELWWATRGQTAKISELLWNELIQSRRSQWPDGTPFQLCLRQSPDQLESLWLYHRPQDRAALTQARQSGRWPIFNHEDELIEHLHRTPGAIALFTASNLRYRGAPLSQLHIDGARPVKGTIYIRVNNKGISSSTLDDLVRLVSTTDREIAVQEWGWLP